MQLSSLSLGVSALPQSTLSIQVATILRKFGSNAHVWMPGPGVPVLGQELVVNGDFSNGTADWDKSTATTISVVNGRLRVALANSTNQRTYQTINGLTIGARYQVSANLYRGTTTGSNTVFFRVSDTANVTSSVPFEQQSGTGDFTVSSSFVATTSTVYVGCVAIETTIDAYFEIDNISIKEITGYSTLLNGFQAANYLEASASGYPQVVDQPVGYVGDAANVTLGPNIVGNSTFDDSSWWGFSGATVSGGKLSLITAGTYVGVSKTNTLIIGKTYQVEADVVINSGTSGVWVGSTLDGIQRATTGKLTGVFTATAATLEVKRASGSFPLDATVDNVIVREITGAIPATQSATSNKPFLRRGHVNRIRNSTMQGALIGTPGTAPTNWGFALTTGISRQVVAKGVVDGMDYIDVRFWGTAIAAGNVTTDCEGYQQVAALVGQTWTTSCYFGLVAGTWPNIPVRLQLYGCSSVGGALESSEVDIRPYVPGTTLARVSLTKLLTNASSVYVAPSLRCVMSIGDTIDFTLRMAAPQLETGSVANSYVPTTTAAASSNTGGYWWEFGMEATPNDHISLASMPLQIGADHFVAMAARPQNNTATHGAFVMADGGTSRVATIYYNGGLWRGRWAGSGGSIDLFNTPTAVGVARVLGVRSVGGGKEFWQDGVKQGATDNTAIANFTATVGTIGAFSPTGNYFSGGIYTTIAINATVSDAEARIIYKWLGQQAGVQIA